MISVAVALQRILEHPFQLQAEEVNLLACVGRVLAQEVSADRDLPPFDRVTMDGIAIRSKDFAAGNRDFIIAGIQAAGAPQSSLTLENHCLEVMTGAVLPAFTDAVVPYEQCQIQKNIATVLVPQIIPRQNIHPQAIDGKAGTILLQKGARLTPAHLGCLASIGLEKVQVYRLPKVAICSTGDELVEISEQPLPHQIRRSNVYMLAAALLQEKIQANLFHLPDHPVIMAKALEEIKASHDVLVCSGAVSKGKYDYLPQVLHELGFQQNFHSVAQKPGKPMLFGILPNHKMVFGLPGNPVSSLVCYHLFIKPWLRASLMQKPESLTACLTEDITFAPSLSYHVPVTLHSQDGVLWATPIKNSGSGDVTSIMKAQALLSLPPGPSIFSAGEAYPVTLL